jgi:hypothetical protein
MNTTDSNLAEVCEAVQVIGLRIDGTRVVISHHESRTAAERTVQLIRRSPDYSKILIESEKGQRK